MGEASSSNRSTSGERPVPAALANCPLCGAEESNRSARFATHALRNAWAAIGVKFSAEAWKTMLGREFAELRQCARCGFRYSDPRLAGDGQFYRELDAQRASYYPVDAPEFRRAIDWARRHGLRTVLDVGCGNGAFLDQARDAGLGTAGVELNPQAAETCQQKGHQAFVKTLGELAADGDGARYDMVTLFQVIEHVPDPVEFLSQAARLLRPGGHIAVAVPNDRGIYRICPNEPHEWPPHHLTRWRQRDLRSLGERCGLRVLRTGANRLLGAEAEHFWSLHNQIAAALGERGHPGGHLLPRLLSFCYRKLGLKFIVPGMGTSVYAFYQRQ